MKKLFTLLSFSLFTILSASQNNQSCQEACPPKCCPKPQPPICCECYLPNYYDLQCDAGLYLYGDFLYWYANEDNLSTCMTVEGNTGTAGTSSSGIIGAIDTLNLVKVNHLGTQWDPGFRACLGFNFDHDGWDLEANYTWFKNHKGHVVSVPGFEVSATTTLGTSSPFFPGNGELALVDPWVNTVFQASSGAGVSAGGVPIFFEKVTGFWKLQFNQIDLDLGRKCWMGKYTALRTYAGARGAWFTTTFSNVAYNLAPSINNNWNNFSDRFKDTLWGVGVLGGLQPEWHFCRSFMLFSNLDAALLWGKFKVRKDEDYASFGTNGVQTVLYHNTSNNVFFKMQAILDVALGLRWEGTWCSRVRTALDIAWENHIWFDTNYRYKVGPAFRGAGGGRGVTPVGFSTYEEEVGNLMMGGGVVRFRTDF